MKAVVVATLLLACLACLVAADCSTSTLTPTVYSCVTADSAQNKFQFIVDDDNFEAIYEQGCVYDGEFELPDFEDEDRFIDLSVEDCTADECFFIDFFCPDNFRFSDFAYTDDDCVDWRAVDHRGSSFTCSGPEGLQDDDDYYDEGDTATIPFGSPSTASSVTCSVVLLFVSFVFFLFC